MNFLTLCGVKRTFGSFDFDIDLEIGRRDYFVLLGPCGSGKTKLLETVAGIHFPEQGQILMDGREVTRIPPECRDTGFVYQNKILFPHLSVAENIAYGLRCRGVAAPERERAIRDIAVTLGISDLLDRRDARFLSGGEMQKVAIARAMVINPKLLLLDEPLSSLDPGTREEFFDFLSGIPETFGVTVLHVTHNIEEALAVGRNIGVIRDGRIRQSGGVTEVLRRPASRFVADFLMVENVLPASFFGRPGRGYLCVRPEDVEIAALPEKAGSSREREAGDGAAPVDAETFVEASSSGVSSTLDKRIQKRGRLVLMSDRCSYVKAHFDVQGTEIVISLGHMEAARNGLALGRTFTLSFPMDRVHGIGED